MHAGVYKTIEITGSSPDSIEDAVRNAIKRTSESVRALRWFSVSEIRGALEKNHIAQWQVTVKVSFNIEE